jgi:cardiolipin synthase
LLKEKSRQGVLVKIIFDSFGSSDLPDKIISDLKQNGIEVLFFSYWLRRTHRKIMLVDEKVAFLGGVNIFEKSRHWNDLQLKLHGLAASRVFRAFAKTYQACGGKDRHIISRYKTPIIRKTKMWIIDHWPIKKRHPLKYIYQENISSAQKNIRIITPYFAPTRWIKAYLHQAVLRGVSVEILIPKKVEYDFISRVNYYYISKLSKIGIKFYLLEHMNHAKAILIDRQRGIIGSQNLDVLSFDFNNEIGVFFEDRHLVKSLDNIFNSWLNDSEIFSGKKLKVYWYDYIIAFFIRILEPIFW